MLEVGVWSTSFLQARMRMVETRIPAIHLLFRFALAGPDALLPIGLVGDDTGAGSCPAESDDRDDTLNEECMSIIGMWLWLVDSG
jgi:hypothetical protein